MHVARASALDLSDEARDSDVAPAMLRELVAERRQRTVDDLDPFGLQEIGDGHKISICRHEDGHILCVHPR